jgi:4-amino-4-deoxy-L-arabinose transferase-like glycosyltransferase
LAWGYFDHPPLVGLLTFLGSKLFTGNLAPRFFTVLLQPITLWIVWKLINQQKADKNKVLLVFIIAASMVMFSAYGFITTPDVPLLFFTALFLYTYKKFLEKQSLVNALFIAVSMAGLVYSKYQGVMLIGLVVLSNLKLLKSRWF